MSDGNRDRIFHELEDVEGQIEDLMVERDHLEEELNNLPEADKA